jgi:glycine cleavage system H protein
MSNIPANLKYSKTDEWVRVEGDEAYIGVSDYAQGELSDVVFVELPTLNVTLRANDPFGTVESVKAASDMHMPIGGTIIGVNSDLLDNTEWVNSDPYGKGWFIKIKPTNLEADLAALMDAAAYETFCSERG